MNGDRLTTHLQRKQYGDFILTEAVRPALDVPVRPRQGYRIHIYRDRAVLSLESSGESLHKRGYRPILTRAPLSSESPMSSPVTRS